MIVSTLYYKLEIQECILDFNCPLFNSLFFAFRFLSFILAFYPNVTHLHLYDPNGQNNCEFSLNVNKIKRNKKRPKIYFKSCVIKIYLKLSTLTAVWVGGNYKRPKSKIAVGGIGVVLRG